MFNKNAADALVPQKVRLLTIESETSFITRKIMKLVSHGETSFTSLRFVKLVSDFLTFGTSFTFVKLVSRKNKKLCETSFTTGETSFTKQ